MKRFYLKGIASFMVALIVSLPIYSSFVLGVLSNGYIYGAKDRVRGYYRKNEEIYINITAWISGDNEINASQIHLYDSKGPSFNSCIGRGDGSFYCVYKMNSNSIKQNPYQLRVALYNDKGVFDSLFILDGAFDEIAPEIRSFNIVPSIIGSGNLNFQYDVYDHSYSNTDSDRCSGINRIELSHNKVFETVMVESLPNQCGEADSITVPLSKVNASEGTVEIFLTAYDKFEQKSSKLSQFTYDPEPPFIDKRSLEIRDMNGNSVEHVGDKGINGVISFIVASNDLDVNNVYGDISDVNIGHIPSYNKKKAECVPFEEGFKCSFTNVEIKLDKSTTVNVKVDAYDIAGNIAFEVLSKDIIYDNVGPSVRAIRTDKDDNYVGGTTRFIVELNEDGAGIGRENIRLDLSNIKSGLSNKAADECIESNGVWSCYWNNIKCDKGDGETTIRVIESSSDKLGNKVSGTLSANFVIDKTAPVVISSSVIGSGVGVEGLEGFIKTGDILEAKLKIKEKSNIRAYADFSPFVTTKGNISGSCVKEGDDWNCEWSTSPKTIDVPGHRIGNVNFYIVDIVGNSVEHKKQIEVMEYERAINVSYWTSSVKCSPNLVDRQITNLVNTRVYCSVTLHPVTANQETLSIELGSCSDNYNGSLGYIENVELVNAGRGSTEPYLSIDLIKGEMTINRLGVICPLKIISRVGTKINKEPEIEPVKVDIGFYNMPLGEYGKGIEAKIQDAKDDAFGGIWKLIGSLKKLLGYAKLMCSVLEVIYNIKLVLQVFTGKLTLAHLTSRGTPLEPIIGPAKTQACIGDTNMKNIAEQSYVGKKSLDPFCKFVNCQLSPPEATNPKIQESKEGSGFWDIAKSIRKGHWFDQYMDWPIKLPRGKGEWVSGTISEVVGKQYYQYANARDNLLVAIVTGCIPGIINGLEKYRQIKCLYADCLEQNAVNNVPVKICEDQKSYATCKYIFGEIFAVLPWTALFDFYMGMIRNALSDPLHATLGLTLSYLCEPDCYNSEKWYYEQWYCNVAAFFSIAGEVINDVNGIIGEYKQIKGDYCKRLKED